VQGRDNYAISKCPYCTVRNAQFLRQPFKREILTQQKATELAQLSDSWANKTKWTVYFQALEIKVKENSSSLKDRL